MTKIQDESNVEVENDDNTEDSNKFARFPEFRRVNSIDCAYWKKVEDDLKLEGRLFRTGHFSVAENDQLKKNWNKLIKKFPLDQPEMLLRKTKCKENKSILREYINRTNFYIHLGHRINRSPYAVYIRARKMFKIGNKAGKFTEEEEEKLLNLESKLGSKWEEIGRELGRSGDSSFKKAMSLRKEVAKGRWTEEEDKQLREAVLMVNSDKKKKLNENKYFKLPWIKISEQVPTRNAKQCRDRWMLHEQTGENDTKCTRRNKKFVNEEKIRLVVELMSFNARDEALIDWMLIHSKFPDAPSPQYLQLKWYSIKRGVVNHKLLNLREILARAMDKLTEDYIKDSSDEEDSKSQTSQNRSQVGKTGLNAKVKLEVNDDDDGDDDDDKCLVEDANDCIGVVLGTIKEEPKEEDVSQENHPQHASPQNNPNKGKGKRTKRKEEDSPAEDQGHKNKKRKLLRNHETPLKENRDS